MRFLIAIATMLCSLQAAGDSFAAYLDTVKARALAAGVSAATINSAFAGLAPDQRIIGFDRHQPEFVQTFDEYLTARVSEFRIREGKRLFNEHKATLAALSKRYQVDANYIVAFWGLESNFGRNQGKHPVIRSLATLGHDPRRSMFFTSELIKALRILDEGHIAPENFVGAWAGAMGQGQFLPSFFLDYAQDWDGDGKKDIWHNEGDVFASIANYLHKHGWQEGAGWGQKVRVPAGFNFETLRPDVVESGCRALRHHTRKMSLAQWRKLGVQSAGLPAGGSLLPAADGSLLPAADGSLPASGSLPANNYALLIPTEGETSTYLVGGNFRTILRYNCANKYAVSVGLLADLIAEG